jgi:DNA-binding response OmpR family regulator
MYWQAKPIPLSKRETEYVRVFALRRGMILSREDINALVYDNKLSHGQLNLISVTLHRIRKKIAALDLPLSLNTFKRRGGWFMS